MISYNLDFKALNVKENITHFFQEVCYSKIWYYKVIPSNIEARIYTAKQGKFTILMKNKPANFCVYS